MPEPTELALVGLTSEAVALKQSRSFPARDEARFAEAHVSGVVKNVLRSIRSHRLLSFKNCLSPN